MQLIIEIFPLFLFFIVFKFYGMYAATAVGIIACILQVLLCRLLTKKWDKKQFVTLIIFVLFGGMTLYFHNPIFVKWKPTIVFWIFSAVILFSHWFMKKTLMQRLMENMLQGKSEIPLFVWKNINFAWGFLLFSLGTINIYIAYYFSDNVWVNFKFYGITCALLLFSILQSIYLMKYISEPKP